MATDTAVTKFTPNALATFEASLDMADEYALELEGFQIATKQDEAKLNELLGAIKTAIGDIENARTAQVGPLNKAVKDINDAWRRPRVALEGLEVTAKRKLTLWLQAEAERIAREQAEARRVAEEQARKAAEAQRQRDDALAKAEAAKNSKAREKAMADAQAAAAVAAAAEQAIVAARAAEPMDAPRGVKTDNTTSGLVERWTYRVTDAQNVPREYLVVSDAAVREAIAASVRQAKAINQKAPALHISGIEIYAEETLSSRTRK